MGGAGGGLSLDTASIMFNRFQPHLCPPQTAPGSINGDSGGGKPHRLQIPHFCFPGQTQEIGKSAELGWKVFGGGDLAKHCSHRLCAADELALIPDSPPPRLRPVEIPTQTRPSRNSSQAAFIPTASGRQKMNKIAGTTPTRQMRDEKELGMISPTCFHLFAPPTPTPTPKE